MLDGEVVALNAKGHPSFQALQHRAAHPNHAIVFYAFDLIHLDGEDLRRLPLETRRARLPKVLKGSGVLLSQALPGSAADVTAAVQQLGLEGVIAKRKDSRYEAAQRTAVWVKLKLDKQQEFVIGGYRPGNHGVDALLVGYYEGKALKFAGKVRAGFTPHLRREVFAILKPLHTAKCPFVDLPNSKTSHWGAGVTAEEMEEMQWVKPKLVHRFDSLNGLPTSAFDTRRSSGSVTTSRRETCGVNPESASAGVRISHPDRIIYPDLGITTSR